MAILQSSLFLFVCFQSIKASFSQETLSCGQTTYSVNFEPTRPMLNSGIPTKYSFQPLQLLIGPDVNICNLTSSTINDPKISAYMHSLETRVIITYCENCSRCMEQLPQIHRIITRAAADAGLQSLLMIVRASFEGIKIDNTLFKFVQMNEEPDVTSVCELVDSVDSDALRSFSKTSVLFVSISFIILMVISLAWLVFYYVQRFRYASAKDRLQRRLFNAAKKALTRIPTRPVKPGDNELELECAICIDPYRIGDIIRVLPCRHIFHKNCSDVWLLEHRTCPMCKSDILKAFGYHVNVTSRRRAQFSAPNDDNQHVVHVTADSDHISADATSTASESNAYPFPVVSEIHDPFNFTPSTSPQLVQVMHTTNARGFSIIPLTVHNPNSAPVMINNAVERHHPITLPTTSFNTGESGSMSAGPTSSGPRILRSAAYTSGHRRSRGHIVNLVHVRSRSLSHSTIPSLPNQTSVEIEHHDRPSALFRSSPSEELPGVVQRVPSPAPEINESPKLQKISRPSTISSERRVPSPARQSNPSPYSAFHISETPDRAINGHSIPKTTAPYNTDAISVESL